MINHEVHVFRKILKNGVEIKIKNKKYLTTYPFYIWEKFPKSLHKIFADSLAFVATWHLGLTEEKSIVYHFSHPPIESVFFKILTYSLPMNVFENKEIKTSEILKKLYNVFFQIQFKGINYHYSGKKVKRRLKEKALLLFSFGKESLLSYGLLNESAVNVIPIFIKEPYSSFENAHKKKLAFRFYERFEDEIIFFPLSFGRLREVSGFYWGWDIILSQYAFVLLPFYFYHQARYLFFGNEQSCNFYLKDKEGYFINPVFEQSISAMKHLADIPKLFFINTHIGSLVEPIHEIFVLYILHHRYSEIGRFQMSCFSEEKEAKKRRWCGVCEKCARIYIFLKALNISPEQVGFYNNEMLSFKKKDLYVIFNGKNELSSYGGSGLGKDEQLLAFYLAYKNGTKGELIELFKKNYLDEVEKRKENLIEVYFGIHSSYTLPSLLRNRVINIFKKEQKEVLDYVRKIIT